MVPGRASGFARNGRRVIPLAVKKQARVACHPSYRGAPLRKCSKGYFRALSAWREGALGAIPRFPTRLRRPFPSFLHRRRGRAASPDPPPQNLFQETNT